MADPNPQAPLTATATYSRVPTVVVDNLHVVYRLQGPAGGSNSGTSALRRVLRGGVRTGAKREVHAVKGVSFVAYEGDAIGLIGTNGSGKSTLLRAIAGLIPPESGAVYTKRQPSLLGVNAALLNDLPGERNVILGCLAMGMPKAEVKARVQEIIEFSGINERGDFASLPMRTYSSGMAARLRFAIAAAKDHDVLLIDEALATGDAAFRRRSEERVQELREGAGTVFLVSHQLSTVRAACERTIWLESGVIRMDGPTDEVVDAYNEFANKGKPPPKKRAATKAKDAPAKPDGPTADSSTSARPSTPVSPAPSAAPPPPTAPPPMAAPPVDPPIVAPPPIAPPPAPSPLGQPGPAGMPPAWPGGESRPEMEQWLSAERRRSGRHRADD